VPLIMCSRCNTLVSDESTVCPFCGLVLPGAVGAPEPSVDLDNGSLAPSISPVSDGRSFPRRHWKSLSLIAMLIVLVVGMGTLFRSHIENLINPIPVILSVTPTRDALPSSGGTVTVSARIGGASTCALALATGAATISVSVPARTACSDGRYVGHIAVGPNPFQRGEILLFRLDARRGRKVAHPAHIAVTIEPSVSESSSNWAGYTANSARPITAVDATWTIPLMHCATGNGGLAVWIGVDGHAELNNTFASNNNLFQAGSESACVNGQQYDDMWWEWSPVNLSNPVFGVSPGDTVTAAVVHASANGQYGWWWVVEDDTTSQSESASSPVAYDGPGATADFVVEDPGVFGKGNLTQPFVGFTPITFSRMAVTTNTPPSYQPFSFSTFDPSGVVDMLHRFGGSLRTLVNGSLPTETVYGYGRMAVTYVGP